MTAVKVIQLCVAIALATAACDAAASESKLTLNHKVDSAIKSDRDLQFNSIPGSSDYVPESLTNPTKPSPANNSHIVNFVNVLAGSTNTNTTRSQANVFEA